MRRRLSDERPLCTRGRGGRSTSFHRPTNGRLPTGRRMRRASCRHSGPQCPSAAGRRAAIRCSARRPEAAGRAGYVEAGELTGAEPSGCGWATSSRSRAGAPARRGDSRRWIFVYEPGHYSLRGGIVDVFSYSASKPYRLDFFGDEVDSIRRFNISSQLRGRPVAGGGCRSIPNLNARRGGLSGGRVSLARFAGEQAVVVVHRSDMRCAAPRERRCGAS